MIGSRDNIKYLAVACGLEKQVISDYYSDEQNRIFSEDVFFLHPSLSQYMGTVKEILAAPNNTPEAVISLASPLGNWVYLVDANNYAFIVLTSAQYPSRLLGALLMETKEKFYEANPMSVDARIKPNEAKGEFMESIVKKYMHPSEYAGITSGREVNMHEFQMKIDESLKQAMEVKPINAVRFNEW